MLFRWMMGLLLVAVGATMAGLALRRGGPREATPPAPAVEVEYVPPRCYVCYRAAGPITVDGRPDEKAWQAAPWSEAFVDIEGDRPR